jgi:hypothetical protein
VNAPTLEERVARLEREADAAQRNVNRIDTVALKELRDEVAALARRMSVLEGQVTGLAGKVKALERQGGGGKNKSGVAP